MRRKSLRMQYKGFNIELIAPWEIGMDLDERKRFNDNYKSPIPNFRGPKGKYSAPPPAPKKRGRPPKKLRLVKEEQPVIELDLSQFYTKESPLICYDTLDTVSEGKSLSMPYHDEPYSINFSKVIIDGNEMTLLAIPSKELHLYLREDVQQIKNEEEAIYLEKQNLNQNFTLIPLYN